MKKFVLSLFALASVSCGEIASSQQNSLGPASDNYVVTGRYSLSDNLARRLSLIMPLNTLQLLTLEGTSEIDVVGLSTVGATVKVNGYEHISKSKFKALRLVSTTNSNIYDLVEDESGRKIGRISRSEYYNPFYFTELCTGTAETLCEFSFDKSQNTFNIKFLETTETETNTEIEINP